MNIYAISTKYLSIISSNDVTKIRFTKAVIWTLLGSIFSRLFTFLSSIGTGRLLGIERFGQFGLIQNLVILIGSTLSTGVSVAVTKLVAQYRDNSTTRLNSIIWLSILLSFCFGLFIYLISLFTSTWIIGDLLKIPSLESEYRISILFVPLSIVNGVILGIVAGLEKFKLSGILYTFRGFFLLIFSVLGAVVNNTYGALVGLVLSELLSLIINYLIVNSCVGLVPSRINFKESNLVIATGLPSILSRTLILPAIWYTNIVLVNQTGGVYSLGLFNAADKLRQLILFVPITVSAAILPIFTNLFEKGEQNDFKKLVNLSLFFNIAIASFPVFFILAFSPIFLSVYGSEFSSGSKSLQLLILSTLPNVVNIVYGQTLISLGKIWKRVLYDIFLSFTIVFCAHFFIPRFLDVGLALSYLVAYLLLAILMAWTIKIKPSN